MTIVQKLVNNKDSFPGLLQAVFKGLPTPCFDRLTPRDEWKILSRWFRILRRRGQRAEEADENYDICKDLLEPANEFCKESGLTDNEFETWEDYCICVMQSDTINSLDPQHFDRMVHRWGMQARLKQAKGRGVPIKFGPPEKWLP